MAKEKKSKERKQPVKVTPERHLTPFEEMDHFFENFFPRAWLQRFGWEHPAWRDFPTPFEAKAPRMDVIERDNDILVRAEIPGVDKDDLDVSLTENTVTVKGKVHREEREEKGDYYRREISAGSFTRTQSLPANVEVDSAKASFKDGILELTVDKAEKAKRVAVEVE